VGKIDQALEYVSRTIYHHRAFSTPTSERKREERERERDQNKFVSYKDIHKKE